MTEMIERVARAMHDTIAIRPWDAMTPSHREQTLAVARAAVEAMREPSPFMIDAAIEDGALEDGAGIIAIYRAMIDEALHVPAIHA